MVKRQMPYESTTGLPPTEILTPLLAALRTGLIPIVNNVSEITSAAANQIIGVRGASAGSVTSRRNLQRDPRAVNSAAFAVGGGTLSSVTDFPGTATAKRHTRNTTGAARINILAPELVATKTYTILLRIRCSIDTSISVLWRPTSTSSSTGQTTFLDAITYPAGVSTIQATATLSSTANAAGSITLSTVAGAVGDTLDVTDILIVEGTVPGTYFDGDTAAAGGLTYAWEGTAGASVSKESRTIYSATLVAT